MEKRQDDVRGLGRDGKVERTQTDLGTPLDLGPVVSVAPDPGDHPWELDGIPTCALPIALSALSSTWILWGRCEE